jgi:hypothetical protein
VSSGATARLTTLGYVGRVSYDLAFWVGSNPTSDEEAAEEFERRAAFMEDEDVELRPATSTMQGFIRELLDRFPALDAHSDDDNIWATGPEPGDINGDFAYLTMTYPGAERAYDFVTQAARKHGLVCYDPQNDSLA